MKFDNSIPGKSNMAYDILAYLADNPDAQDTLEGIAEWWLLQQRIKHEVANVKTALAELVAEDLVVERQGKDLRKHYRINRGRFKEIKTLIGQKRGKQTGGRSSLTNSKNNPDQ